MKKILLKTMLLLCTLVVGSSAWATDYDELFTISAGSIVSGTSYKAHTATVDSKGYVITFGGNNSSVGTNSGNRSNCNLSSYSKYAVSPVTTSSTASAFACTTSISDVSKISYTFSGGSNQTNTNVYLLYSEDNSTFSQVTLTSGTQGAAISSGTEYTFEKSSGFFALLFVATNSSGAWRIDGVSITFYQEKAPDYTITAQSNNNSYGTVSLSGSVITANPETGYRVSTSDPYTVSPANSATVSQSGNAFTVTPSANTTVTINFEAIPTYTVTFNAEGGSCTTTSLTEASGGGGVTLPTATCGKSGWNFAGWATTASTSTTTRPTLYAAGETFHPTTNTVLYAVYYVEGVGSSQYKRAASVDEVTSASSVAIVTNKNSYILNHELENAENAPAENEGKITVSDNYIFSLSGNNTEGFTLSSTGDKKVGPDATPTSSSNSKVLYITTDITTKWIVEKYANNDNIFVLRIAGSDGAVMQYFSNDWKSYYTTNYSTDADGAMKIYVPEVLYNSNPTSGIIQPSVAFEKGNTTLYLDGINTYTNIASVTGIEKSVSTYKSSNTSVATVNESGEVTAVGIGTATITATLNAELGVHKAASASYDVVIKNTTTIAGIKNLTSTSTTTAFSADLTDAVVTYVKDNHAYIQDASAAIYVSYSGHGLVAGNKINGAVSGSVKAPNQIDQIIALNLEDATVTDDGVAPAAVVKTLAEIKTAGTDYDGKLVTVNAATLTNSLAINQNTNSVSIKDGSQIEDTDVQFTIYAPNQGITLTNKEKGNFTGFVSIYVSGTTTTYRLNLYEQSQFVKTHNVPQNQDMAFATTSYNPDEETDAVTSFVGQEVTQTNVKGTVTYSIKAGGDDIITSLNPSTGAVVLNGNRGKAIIVATAAYAEETGGNGYITPYNEQSTEYTITVRPRYTVTFSVNGVETSVREESYNAGVTVPANPSEIGAYSFQGWSNATVATTDTKPTLASLTAGNNYKPSGEETYYAVYAIQAQTGTTDVLDQSYSYSEGNWTVGGDAEDRTSSSYLLLHEGGYVESATFDLSIISKVVVYGGTFGGGSNNSLTISDGTNVWKEVTVVGSSNTGKNEFTDGNALTGNGKLRVTSTCGGTTNGVRITKFEIYKLGPVYGYTDYTTSITASASISAVGYATYVAPFDIDFTRTENLIAYRAESRNSDNVVLKQVEAVPSGEAVVLKGTAGPYTLYPSIESVDPIENLLKAATTDIYSDGTDGIYVLNVVDGVVGFYTLNGTLTAGKAYLELSSTAKFLGFSFEEEEDITGLNEVDSTNEKGERTIYDLMGRKVAQPTHGLYIVNGKKVFIK